MSVRLLTVRLVKHGHYVLRTYWHREIHTNILEQSHLKKGSKRAFCVPSSAANVLRSAPQQLGKSAPTNTANVLPRAGTGSGLFRFGQQARKLFIDNILSRVTTNYSEELRQRATRKLFFGDSAPFFALIGVSLASGAGVLSKEDELEGVCWEIREAATRLQENWNRDELSDTLLQNDLNVDKLDVGPPIAKGCAAVVYAASVKQERDTANTEVPSPAINMPKSPASSWQHEMMSPLQNMSRFVHNFGGSADNIYSYCQKTAISAFVEGLAAEQRLDMQTQSRQQSNESGNKSQQPQDGMSNAYRLHTTDDASTVASIERYPLALKIMFNFDAESNATSILRAMYRETVPARQRHMNGSSEEWQRLLQNQTLSLPPHPNIVCMFGFFCDEVRNFPDGHKLYPQAQPQRINPDGYGRNMSLYLLMKRYDCSLRELLVNTNLKTRFKVLLLAQMLEAVAHLNRHGVAHRDIKSDNLLIELNDEDTPPVLVLSDFGCCLADKGHGLRLPYSSDYIEKGGNAALMAPEIYNTQPGPFAELNYGKADLWACGALAYEIFGMHNPFYSVSAGLASGNAEQTLRNSDYKHEDLPPLNDACPPLLQKLVYNILNPNPSKRVSPDIAANVLQLFLWAPSNWLKAGGMPNSPEILQWLISLTTKIMCEGRPQFAATATFLESGRRTYVEYLLICSFLARARLRRIRGALNWIQNVVAA